MSRRWLAACAALAVLLPSAAHAQVAVSLKAGTLGPSLGLIAGLSEKFNLRVDVPYFTYDYSSTHTVDDFDLDYTTTVDLFSASAIADVHPFGNALRLSVGALYNNNEASFLGMSGSSQTVGNRTYSPEEIGTLSGVIGLGSQIVPYAGIGFGNAVAGSKRLGFLLDMGVVYMGEPDVTLSGTGMIAPTATEEQAQIEENLSWAKYYPNFSIGLTYRIR